MKTRIILIVAAVLIFTCAGFAQQGFSVFLFNDFYMLRQVGTDCDNGAPLPDGTPIEIRWDQNNNGVYNEGTDPLAPLCAQPPDCPGGPAGTVNYNTFLLNGQSQGMGAGYFAVEVNFTSVGTISPARFFLVIRCVDGSVHYVSQALYFTAGPQEVNVSQWMCMPCYVCCPYPCTPEVTFTAPGDVQCITVCQGLPTTVRVAIPLEICQVKHLMGITVLPCSANPLWDCHPGQPDGIGEFDPLAWTYEAATGNFINVIQGIQDGCMAVVFDGPLTWDPVDYYWNPQAGDPLSLCVLVDPVGWHDACIGPFAPGNHPVLHHQPGCQEGSACAESNLPPPNQGYFGSPVYFPNLNLYLWNASAWDMHGYACLTLDNFLPVEMLSFTATPRAEAIELTWRTGSESNIASFRAVRSSTGESETTVGRVPATNHPGGADYTLTDHQVQSDERYVYQLYVSDVSGNETRVDLTAEATPGAPEVINNYALHQNFPNPFNPETQITFDLLEAGHVNLTVYNLAGQEVAVPVNGERSAGRQVVTFDAGQLPSGMYLYRLNVNGFSAAQKMVLMK